MKPEPRDIITALAVIHRGDWAKIYRAMQRRELPPDEEVFDILSGIRSKVLTCLDDQYPAILRDACIRPPFVLFYYGDISLIQDYTRILTVVGSRDPTDYTVAKTREFCKEMVQKDYILCSGLAYGVDTIAAEEGLVRPGHAIAVLGNGIERTYPLENTPLRDRIVSTGLLLSEYPDNVMPEPKNFPLRNRILAGIGKAVFASEVNYRSGTSITVSLALQMNRDVGMLPFRAGEDKANNIFIKSGAALVETPEDLLSLMQGRLCFNGKFL